MSLEDVNCKIKPGCQEHPPWPQGICTKCQPSAVMLNRQVTLLGLELVILFYFIYDKLCWMRMENYVQENQQYVICSFVNVPL